MNQSFWSETQPLIYPGRQVTILTVSIHGFQKRKVTFRARFNTNWIELWLACTLISKPLLIFFCVYRRHSLGILPSILRRIDHMRSVNQAYETISRSDQSILSLVSPPIASILAIIFSLMQVVIFLVVGEGKVPPSITS